MKLSEQAMLVRAAKDLGWRIAEQDMNAATPDSTEIKRKINADTTLLEELTPLAQSETRSILESAMIGAYLQGWTLAHSDAIRRLRTATRV